MDSLFWHALGSMFFHPCDDRHGSFILRDWVVQYPYTSYVEFCHQLRVQGPLATTTLYAWKSALYAHQGKAFVRFLL